MLRIVTVFLASFVLVQHTHADTIILKRAEKNSSGVQIIAGGWGATNPAHTDATYRAFNSLRAGKLGRYDFYYSLQIDPQFTSKFPSCESNPSFRSFFRALFGVSTAAVVVVKADVQYRWTTGNAVDFVKGDAGLVIAATGAGGANPQPGNGCYFDQTMNPTFPLLQYGGGGEADQNFDDFVIKFIVAGGSSENLNAVQNLVGLFSQISALAGWSAITSGIASPESQTFQKTAQSFQAALKDAGVFQNQRSVNYVLRSNGGPNDGRIAITIPGLFGDKASNGYMAIYVSRQGSIALRDGSPTISLSTVFDNQVLPNRQCNPANIASGKCDSNTDTLRIAIAKQLVGIDDKVFKTPGPDVLLLDANSDRKGKVYETCKALRTIARLNLHLATLDEMMIRWAATKEGHVQDALNDGAKAQDLAKANNVSVKDLQDMCWNSGDDDTIKGVARILHKTFE